MDMPTTPYSSLSLKTCITVFGRHGVHMEAKEGIGGPAYSLEKESVIQELDRRPVGIRVLPPALYEGAGDLSLSPSAVLMQQVFRATS